MEKSKIKPRPMPKNVFKLEDYRVQLSATLKCEDCSYLNQSFWPAYVAVEDLHCPDCSNQSLIVYDPTAPKSEE